MIQTTLFKYFTSNNESLKLLNYKPLSTFKQTSLTDYFKIIPKKKNVILDYFKHIEEVELEIEKKEYKKEMEDKGVEEKNKEVNVDKETNECEEVTVNKHVKKESKQVVVNYEEADCNGETEYNGESECNKEVEYNEENEFNKETKLNQVEQNKHIEVNENKETKNRRTIDKIRAKSKALENEDIEINENKETENKGTIDNIKSAKCKAPEYSDTNTKKEMVEYNEMDKNKKVEESKIIDYKETADKKEVTKYSEVVKSNLPKSVRIIENIDVSEKKKVDENKEVVEKKKMNENRDVVEIKKAVGNKEIIKNNDATKNIENAKYTEGIKNKEEIKNKVAEKKKVDENKDVEKKKMGENKQVGNKEIIKNNGATKNTKGIKNKEETGNKVVKNKLVQDDDIKKKNKKKKSKKEPFDIVLIDVKETRRKRTIQCVKRNMNDPDLKYIALSYRWGELDEQYVKTPDYTALVTSFDLMHLIGLCFFMSVDKDLQDLRYLWIDAISVDQINEANKKETMLKMSEIYNNASHILAIPDLHKESLSKNPANREMLNLIEKYNEIIYSDIKHSAVDIMSDTMKKTNNASVQQVDHHYLSSSLEKLKNHYMVCGNETLKKEIKEIETEIKGDELKKAYQFLAYLMNDWSIRSWAISEYQIAREKYEEDGTPLKYIFLSLLYNDELMVPKSFFSYHFTNLHQKDEDDDNYNDNNSTINNKQPPTVKYHQVDNGTKFNQFLQSKLIPRNYVDMIVKSKATKNEDRFHSILPLWEKYKDKIENENTITNWNITDMISVKLKLYEIMDEDDLWNKARLLCMCSILVGRASLPSFATYNHPYATIEEIDDDFRIHKQTYDYLLRHDNTKDHIKNRHKKGFKSLFKQNVLDIQFNKQSCSLSMKIEKYFIFNASSFRLSQEELSYYSFKDNDDLKLIYISYFTYRIPQVDHPFPLDRYLYPTLGGILLLGSYDLNRWVQVETHVVRTLKPPNLFTVDDDYIFKVY